MVYTPLQGRSLEEKEEFYEAMQEIFDTVNDRNNIILQGDWSGHLGIERD